jgi:hypothetical protein
MTSEKDTNVHVHLIMKNEEARLTQLGNKEVKVKEPEKVIADPLSQFGNF